VRKISHPTGIRSPDRPARSSVAIPTELPGPQHTINMSIVIKGEVVIIKVIEADKGRRSVGPLFLYHGTGWGFDSQQEIRFLSQRPNDLRYPFAVLSNGHSWPFPMGTIHDHSPPS
jgi:hypothetical protein